MKTFNIDCSSMFVLLFIIFALLLLATKPLYSQENKDNFRVNFTYYNNQRYVKEIEFVDVGSGETIKTFDIVDNNPYNNLNYPLIDQSKQGYNIYDVDGVQIKYLQLEGPFFASRRNLTDSFVIEDGAIKSYHELCFTDTSHIIVKYHLNLYMGGVLVGVSNTVFLFMNNGELIRKFDQFTTQCLYPCITSDGKYFAYCYGGVVDESLDFFDDLGYVVYNLSENRIVVSETLEKKYNDIATTNDSAIIRIACMTMDSDTYIVYDFMKMKKFEKEYHNDVLGLWRKVTKYGFIFEEDFRGSGKYRTDFYETDFKVEEIK